MGPAVALGAVALLGLVMVVAGGRWGAALVVVGLLGLPFALQFPALGWFIVGALSGAVLWLVTLVLSQGETCGAFDSGPNTPAQERYCDSALADLLPFFPVVPIVVGTAMAMHRRRGWPLFASWPVAVIVVTVSLAALP